MINNAINAALCLLTTIFLIRNFKKGLLLYTAAIFLAPVFIIASARISFEILFFPVVFIISLLKSTKISNDKSLFGYFGYLFLFLIVSMFQIILGNSSFPIMDMYAFFRFMFLVYLFHKNFKTDLVKNIDMILTIVLIVNTVFCVCQMSGLLSVRFFYNLYYKESLYPLKGQLEIGSFSRAFGSFGSPLIIACVSALSFSFYLGTSMFNYEGEKVNHKLLKIAMSLVCGILSMSKTVILSIPVIIVVALLYYLIESKKRGKKIKILIFFVAGLAVFLIGFFFLANYLNEKGYAINYYLSFLTNPLSSLDTRYSGNLVNTTAIIKSNILFGVGSAVFTDVYVGDSLYYSLLYQVGVVGLLLFLLPLFVVLLRSFNRNFKIEGLLIMCFLLIGVGSPVQLAFYTVPFVALFLKPLYSRRNYCEQRLAYNKI